eukprot:CAMPEP_0178590528 /NCGR_PEP_ID=MMETSP0697-20121206/28269_1 /TAXON_ID=265572 /ORGANISM="Extubocellulus spinifer, Strain CCMP396" /LENGTH=310 /DNA_ID=CAMNT_0020227259 /DNA_START=26 /DNA_END=958 /DNA_ORIENTATION=-
MTTGKRSLRSAALVVTLPLVVSGFGVVSRGAVSTIPSTGTRSTTSSSICNNSNGVLKLTTPPVVGVSPAALVTGTAAAAGGTSSGSNAGSRLSPLFVASESNKIVDDLSEGNKKALQSIEKEIEKANKQKEKYLEKVSKFDDISSTLEKKKNDYLQGLSLGKVSEGANFSETTARSAVKALMWRVIAGSVTFVTSLKFSGSIKVALSIVGSDFLSKAATMFIGERLMNKSQAGRKSGADDAGRSLAKALIWRLFAICNTLAAGLLISKDLSVASKIAGSDAIFKTALMFVYERVWAKIEWGKEYQIDFLI